MAQHRSKLLLHNILPEEIVPKLLQPNSSGSLVELFESATMMFVNFTNMETVAEDLDAGQVFQIYNEIFTLFDEATHSLGLEKIKTINSVYMVASGLPKIVENHAELAILLAIELYRIASHYMSPLMRTPFRIRIGIATGPVVAGIIGRKKYAYDCWSDTTNMASRMESNGWNGYAQVTHSAYELLKDKFSFKKRENLFIKGKGIMDTYVLKLSSLI